MTICQSCGTPLPKSNDPDERYFTVNEQFSFCYDCYGSSLSRFRYWFPNNIYYRPIVKNCNYSSGIKKAEEWLGKEQASQYYRDKISEENEKLSFLYEQKKQHLKTQDVPDWFIELGLEIINERITKVQKNIKNLVFKYDILTGARQESKSYRVHDLEAIKAIPITDLMPSEPKMRAPNRLFYMAPWRNEENPSLVVYIDSNSWHDFGEATGGSNIDLFMRLNDCEFKDAVKELSNLL